MRVLHDDAMRDDDRMKEYRQKYYPLFLQVFNHGGYCLVSPLYFNVGLEVLKIIRNEVNEKKLREDGNSVLVKGLEKLKSNKSIREMFDSCHLDKIQIHADFLQKTYLRILTATFNSRVKAVTTAFKVCNTGRYASKSSDTSFRNTLQVMEKAKCERVAKRQKKDE